MRLCKLAFALVVSLTANSSNAGLPSEADPPPFTDITLPASVQATANHAPSTSAPPVRPYGPFATVDDLGDPERIEFRGLSQVRDEDVRLALRWDPMFQAAARPSNGSADFLTVLESRLLDGFQSSGFAHAKVKTSSDITAKRFVVIVTEGRRFRQGKIVVTGDDHVDAKQLVDWLTQEQMPRRWTIRYANSVPSAPSEKGVTLWTPGVNLNSTPRVRKTLEAGVRWALVEQGFPYATFDIEFVPAAEPGLADLHVKLRHVGSPSTIKEINAEGLNRDTREQLLNYLQIAPGAQLDATLLDRIHLKLADSCRYWTHEIVVRCSSKPDGRYAPADQTVTLDLVLEEFSLVPPLYEPLSEVDEVLRKAAAWINSYPNHGSPDLVFEKVGSKTSTASDQFTIRPSAASADGRVVINLAGKPFDGWAFDHAVLLSSSKLAAVDWSAKQKFVVSISKTLTLKLSILASRLEDGAYAQRLLTAWSTLSDDETEPNGSVIWTVHAEPVAVVYSAYRPDSQAEIKDGILKIKSRHIDYEFDADTGALIQLTARGDVEYGEFRARMVPGGYDAIAEPLAASSKSFVNRFDSERPIASTFAFAVEQLQKQPFVDRHELLATALQAAILSQKFATTDRLTSLLDQELHRLQSEPSPASDAAQKFLLTPTLSAEGDSIRQIVEVNVIYYVPGLADRLFPRGSWPWTLTREAAFLVLAEGTGDEPVKRWNQMVGELARLERDEQFSPIAAWCCLKVVRLRPENQALAALGARVAACGIRQSTDEQLAHDIELIASGDGGFARTVQRLVDDFTSLSAEDQQAFLSILPEPFGQMLSQIQQERIDKPNETAGEALAHVLRDRWREIAGKEIEKRLREHAATEVDVPKTAVQASAKSETR